ncbi:MAG: hypothetical protein MN733_20950, partial [Nitrososphaera sp.]|nr:hypothetical protein [Nitrososphaera sp.]
MNAPFDRPSLVVASLHKPVTKALKYFLNLFLGEELPHHFPENNICKLSCVEDLHTRLDSMERRELFNTVCVVDLTAQARVRRDIKAADEGIRPGEWDINAADEGIRPGELVLRYPEVYWIFVVVNEQQTPEMPDTDRSCHFVDLTKLTSLPSLLLRHAQGFRTWFDPTGFRRWIREGDKNHEQRRISSYGIAIDEEVSFALLNGYVLYRNDHATFVVSSLSEMNCVMDDTKGSLGRQKNPNAKVYVMEDVELNFGDATLQELEEGNLIKTNADNYSDMLKKRKEKYRVLGTPHRLFVTAASIRGSGGPEYRTVAKPYGGMFDPKLDRIRVAAVRKKRGRHYHSQRNRVQRHSAPFRAQQIADALLIRARRLEREAPTARRAIHVALLASEARRLLGNRTLALSLEALAIQHRMEVTAECTFIGTASQLEVKARFRELKRDITTIVGTKKYSSHQINNALVEIADDLRQIYRQYDQFAEEDEALRKLRTYEWKLKYLSFGSAPGLLSRLWAGVKLIIAGIPELYFNFVMGGFSQLALCIVLLVIIFAEIYANRFPYTLLIKTECYTEYYNYYDWLRHSATTFFSLQQGISGDPKITG